MAVLHNVTFKISVVLSNVMRNIPLDVSFTRVGSHVLH